MASWDINGPCNVRIMFWGTSDLHADCDNWISNVMFGHRICCCVAHMWSHVFHSQKNMANSSPIPAKKRKSCKCCKASAIHPDPSPKSRVFNVNPGVINPKRLKLGATGYHFSIRLSLGSTPLINHMLLIRGWHFHGFQPSPNGLKYGYLQSSSIFVWDFSVINQPASLGYPHGYGNP